MEVFLIGGGIGGLMAALCLHQVGIRCRVFEANIEFKRLGVGINLHPHAMRELSKLGLEPALTHLGVVAKEKSYFTSHGQLVFSEPCGHFAGLDHPHVAIHRADLHDLLLSTVIERLGRQAVAMGHTCIGIEQDRQSVTAHFSDTGIGKTIALKADIAVACDGLHSAVRRQLYQNEPPPLYSGFTSWRGLVRAPPFLSGASMVLVGTLETALFMGYPIKNYPDGSQLMNLIASVPKNIPIEGNSFSGRGRLEDFIDHFKDWTFSWIDISGLFASADAFLELPLVDRDPLNRWTFGRVTLLGDAAHPMSPRGGNGAAQSMIDAATLAQALANEPDLNSALEKYEAQRRPVTNNIVLANRESPPDTIIRSVEDRTEGRSVDNLDKAVNRAELEKISKNYKRVTGAIGNA